MQDLFGNEIVERPARRPPIKTHCEYCKIAIEPDRIRDGHTHCASHDYIEEVKKSKDAYYGRKR